MKFFKMILFGLFAAAALAVSAEYEVKLTFVNGVVRTLSDLTVQGGKVILAGENLQVPFDQIKEAEFTFKAEKGQDLLTAEQCEVFLKRAAYKEMADQIDALLEPVKQGLALPGNLDVYIQYKMRASFWTGQYDEALRLVQLLRSKQSAYAPLAGLYEVLAMVEEGRAIGDVRAMFEETENPEAVSGAMTEYIRGRLALEDTNYDQALQHFARVLVYYRRDLEWVPAATFQEGSIYKWGGEYDALSEIRKELKLAYPDSYWGERAAELN
jgi:tetratricopeptide (TPR) repeat protein